MTAESSVGKPNRTQQHEKVKVTARNIGKLPDGTYRIDKGVYLRKRDGRGTFFMRLCVEGKRKDFSVGSAADLTIELAIAKARRMRVQIQDGTFENASDKRRYTLNSYWEGAVRRFAQVKQWKDSEKRIATIRYQMEKYVLPIIGHVDVRKISRKEIYDVVGGEWCTKPSLCDRLRNILSMVLGIAQANGLISENPARFKGSMEYLLPPQAKVRTIIHRPAATLDQTREIVKACSRTPHLTKRIILFVAMTAVRVGEATSVRWEDVDLENGVAVIRDEEMKVRRGFNRRIPLARQLVEEMSRWERSGIYVFTSDGKTRASKTSPAVTLKNLQNGITMHGFRSTFSDWAMENGIVTEVAERCLDHDVGSRVRRAYQRSDLFDMRREALQRYADALMG